ncbi:hypothetical protein Patl1_25137 [Pistacia atlantica]|uniref:Uncharacterized protein n=1 Tax=Pistacia atlantica TaxID=434234 RepID=A0ACC1B1Q4_9ROSI|nr:hypothetical protein Patl1_25137 [Pistacia atlantica]
MDQHMETLENIVQSLSNGQQALLHQMNEFMSQVNSKIDKFSSHTRGETSNNREVSSNPHNNNHSGAFGATYSPKLVKLDFPRYNEDEVQLWFQLLKQETDNLTWDEFKHHLHSQYQAQFERLLAKAGPLSTERKVSCFASGLKDAIRTEVMANRPTTLSEAISLARLFEAKVAAQKKVSLPTKGVPPALKPLVFSPATVSNPIKKLSLDEVSLTLQGVPLNVDLYVLPLEGYDIVLGTQWLQALGPVIWDFSRMVMRFSLDGKKVTLRGSSMPKDEVVYNFMIEKVT